MAILGGLLAGGAIGVTHALEADHVAAVLTMVDSDRDRSPAVVGASWGVGHALPIAALALGFLAVGLTVPASLTQAVEALVGVVLIALGVRMLAAVAGWVALDGHRHDGHRHRHLTLGRLSFGITHSHLDDESLLVGMLHGVAGSGVLVVALVASRPTLAGSIGTLAGFVTISVATMALVSLLWGRSLETGLERPLRLAAGAVGVAAGLLLLAQAAGVATVL